MLHIRLLLVLFSCTIGFSTAQEATTAKNFKGKKPKNIILLIGDGMGLSQISATQFYSDDPSSFERFQTIGLIKTTASDKLVTDSAASGTAYATGEKTYNGAIGLKKDSIFAPNIVEFVSEKGMSTGVVSTSSITHATPASFYAHVKSRRMYDDIASALVGSEIDFFAGGGLEFFNKREDKRNLLTELKANGFDIDTVGLSIPGKIGKLGFLLAEDGMPKMIDGRGDFLPKATQLALFNLSLNKKGFFLMVEGSQIDWGGHSNEADYLIAEQIDFDKTVGLALDFAERQGETLVIVTADHETGGFTLSAADGDYGAIDPRFSTKSHSATMIPIFAKGPGASLFDGIYENTELYNKMMLLLKRK